MNLDNDLRNVDLNLLRVFDVLHPTRSTTRAAQALNLTQPSVSNALKRLREMFDDVLFVKTADGMQPTPRAEGIAALIDEGFASLRLHCRLEAHSIQPRQRAPSVSMSAILDNPSLSRRLQRAYARWRRESRSSRRTRRSMPPSMKLGQIDLAIGLFKGLHADFLQQRLFHETYAVLVRKDHPAIGAKLSAKQFFAADHVTYTPTAGSHSRFVAELNTLAAKSGKTRRVALQLAHSSGLDRIIASSDLVACVPSSLARALAGRGGLCALALPFDIAPLAVNQFWHERFQRDDGHHWLRAIVYELFHDDRLSKVP